VHGYVVRRRRTQNTRAIRAYGRARDADSTTVAPRLDTVALISVTNALLSRSRMPSGPPRALRIHGLQRVGSVVNDHHYCGRRAGTSNRRVSMANRIAWGASPVESSIDYIL
jgi:hypothetical protein